MQKWPKYPLVYEINTRVWLAELSARYGRKLTLDLVPDSEIESIASKGFHAVWLMGVWTTGDEPLAIAREHTGLQQEYRKALPDFTPADVIGSPYAITTYQVSAALGGRAALARLRQRLATNGLRLILDFVSNHTSRDHHFVIEHPEYYVYGTEEDLAREPQNFFRTASGHILAHGRDPYFPGWTDTAQINYAQPSAREAMKQKLLDICSQCDGIRCDMAMLIVPEVIEKLWGHRLGSSSVKESFWKEALPAVLQRHPGTLFIAESYWNMEWQLQQQGFHFTYDKTLYDRLKKKDYGGVRAHLQGAGAYQDSCLRFVENHDEERAVTTFGAAYSRSAAVATFFTPGLRLFHEGQLEGHRIKIPVQLARRPHENEDVETAHFYEKLLGVLQDPVFHSGQFTLLNVNSPGWGDASNASLLAMQWTPDRDAGKFIGYVIVVNLSGMRAYGRIPLPAEKFRNKESFVFLDRYDGKRYDRAGDELAWPGLYVALEAYQPHLFEVMRA
ncbi:MAG TPA: alpha-amylase family glycosyl hydrolase [Planctomycetota bacterium]|nr:alpha-amylase family glycosyl hydrolase [Planctomycetota bacterium]